MSNMNTIWNWPVKGSPPPFAICKDLCFEELQKDLHNKGIKAEM